MQAAPTMADPRSSCGLATLHDALYCVAGNAGDDQFHSTVEVLSPAAGKWRSCAPLGHACSGLALAAI
jgi:hypothetical protein